jgi:hypothetical protein
MIEAVTKQKSALGEEGKRDHKNFQSLHMNVHYEKHSHAQGLAKKGGKQGFFSSKSYSELKFIKFVNLGNDTFINITENFESMMSKDDSIANEDHEKLTKNEKNVLFSDGDIVLGLFFLKKNLKSLN